MLRRREFVEPLLRTYFRSSDLLLSDNDFGNTPVSIYCYQYSDDQSVDIPLHRLMISMGVYDDLYLDLDACSTHAQWTWDKASQSLMSHSLEHFEYFRANFFPDFYDWPVDIRLENLPDILRSWCTDFKTIPRFFRDTDVFYAEDLTPFGLVEWYWLYVALGTFLRWGNTHKRQWEGIRWLYRAMASVLDPSDLTAHLQDRLGMEIILPFCENAHCPRCYYFRSKATSHIAQDLDTRTGTDVLRELLRLRMEDLQRAGHDLVAYGQAMTDVYRQHPDGLPKVRLWERYEEGGKWRYRFFWCKVKSLNYGPSPEDWHYVWDIYPAGEVDETDFMSSSDSEGDTGSERKQLMPGSWVDDEEEGDGKLKGTGGEEAKEIQESSPATS
jgi:hypothetical protein